MYVRVCAGFRRLDCTASGWSNRGRQLHHPRPYCPASRGWFAAAAGQLVHQADACRSVDGSGSCRCRCSAGSRGLKECATISMQNHFSHLLLDRRASLRIGQYGCHVRGHVTRRQPVIASGQTQAAADGSLRACALVSLPLGPVVHAQMAAVKQAQTEIKSATKSALTIDLPNRPASQQRAAPSHADEAAATTDPGCCGSSHPRGHASEERQGGTTGGSRSGNDSAAAPAIEGGCAVFSIADATDAAALLELCIVVAGRNAGWWSARLQKGRRYRHEAHSTVPA